ncbi:LuxR C-terminal-related transcriptional regulator [Sphingomonas arenae]|uniref:LuxR C-terminal-related transcriptional regulator n=1 Tax=Sphingomonas arenae TaxID=2812555 RepID=UPI0019670E81
MLFKPVAEVVDLPQLALSWLASDEVARLLVDDQLLIRWTNAVASSWLDSRAVVASVEGRLCVGRSDAELGALLARARFRPEGTCIPLQDGASHLIVCARRVSDAGQGCVYGLSLRRTDEQCSGRAVGLGKAYGLTACEEGIAQLLFHGATAQEAAERLKISVETVRTHIRRLYQKLGVNSREALLTQVRPFMMMF